MTQKKEIVDTTAPETERLVGVDCGTMNIVLAEETSKGEIEISSIRNMYLPLDKSQMTMAEMSNIDYVEADDQIFIIGEDAYRFGNMFGKEVSRPMSGGLISSTDIDSVDVLTLILKQLAGTTYKGKCVYSIPSASLDKSNNVVYHENVFKRVFNELGFVSGSFNEAMAIIYSQCQKEKFTGLSFSFGAGMVNCALSYKSVPILTFSVARSGDWIDQKTSESIGVVSNRVTSIKEKGTDLRNFNIGGKRERRIREAIIYYYREAISHALKNVTAKLEHDAGDLELQEGIPIIVSGGTSLATGFMDIFNEVLSENDDFPLEISEVRRAKDPLSAVAEGLLIKGMIDKKSSE